MKAEDKPFSGGLRMREIELFQQTKPGVPTYVK
jgi:hypothetical protein